nr:hypothetical protein [uncultured Anaerocolumna sp.]
MKYESCFVCCKPIYYEDELHDQDDAFEIDGNIICDDCVLQYVREHNFKKLKEESYG